MPFDPNYPTFGQPFDPVPMRAQFQSLKQMIEALSAVTSVSVVSVNSVPPGTPAAASASLDSGSLQFSFDLPQGDPGATGEVSASQMNEAISSSLISTSSNSNGVSTLDTNFADPDMESLRQKLNELISALRR